MTQPIAEQPRMKEYGVGGPDWKPLPWTWAAERLASCHNFWVVTATATGRPHAMPVWGVWDEAEHRFGFSCAHSETGAEFFRQKAFFEVVPQLAFAVIEREDEFSNRATRWRFAND